MTKSVPQHFDSDRQNILRPFLVSLGFIFFLIYSLVAFNTGDAFWFIATTNVSAPLQIIIYDEGERIVYQPGDPEFERLTSLIEDAISRLNNNALIGIGLSDVTLDDYANLYTVMEVHYDAPIKFGTAFRTDTPTRLLFPLTGRHAGIGLFFRGNNEEWFYGALRMADPLPLYNVLEELGYIRE